MALLNKIKVAVISVTATDNKSQNIENALTRAEEAVNDGASWVVLPEMFAYHGPYQDLWNHAEFENGPLNQRLADFSCRHGVVLFAGSVAERPENSTSGKVFNTQYVFGRKGELLAKYRKIHLFNLLNSDGRPLYCESDGYLAGNQIVTLKIDGWNVGLATCYDLRFTEMFVSMNKDQHMDCLVVPAAFTLQTGMYHWELLLRARAVDNLCYVVAPNQIGTHSPGKQSFGHAMIIDPWGNTIADTGNSEGLAIGSLLRSRISACRSQLPALNNKRQEVYK